MTVGLEMGVVSAVVVILEELAVVDIVVVRGLDVSEETVDAVSSPPKNNQRRTKAKITINTGVSANLSNRT